MILQPARAGPAGQAKSQAKSPGDAGCATRPLQPVLRVHGTAANRKHEGEADWWHPESAFEAVLDGLLQAAGTPARCAWPGGSSRDAPFAWSGANSEQARRDGGRALAARLASMEADPQIERYHLVGHSHGGNVILEALRSGPAPTKLGAVVFMGTPVLRFRHAQAFDERWLSAPIQATLLTASIVMTLRPGDDWFIWPPFALVLAAALIVDLSRGKPRGQRREAELYGSGMPSAFVFEGDEAINALLTAQQVVRQPRLFIRQFTRNEPPPPYAVTPQHAPTPGLESLIERSGAMAVMRWLKLDTPFAAAEARPAAGPAPLSTSTAVDTPPGVAEAARTALASWPLFSAVASVALHLAALLPAAVLLTVGTLTAALSWLWARLLPWIAIRLAIEAGCRSLPLLLEKAAFGADEGRFIDATSLPPGVLLAEAVATEALRELHGVGNRVDSAAGAALLGAMATVNAFSIREQIEAALSDTSLVHSHYHRSNHVLERIAGLITAGSIAPWPLPLEAPFAGGLGWLQAPRSAEKKPVSLPLAGSTKPADPA